MSELDQIRAAAEIVNTLGTVGLLFLLLSLFYTGRILPRSVHNEIVKAYRDQAERLSEQLAVLVEELKKLAEMITSHNRRYDEVIRSKQDE